MGFYVFGSVMETGVFLPYIHPRCWQQTVTTTIVVIQLLFMTCLRAMQPTTVIGKKGKLDRLQNYRRHLVLFGWSDRNLKFQILRITKACIRCSYIYIAFTSGYPIKWYKPLGEPCVFRWKASSLSLRVLVQVSVVIAVLSEPVPIVHVPARLVLLRKVVLTWHGSAFWSCFCVNAEFL